MRDFSKIHPFAHGQRMSFEELVCQLARHESFPDGSIYKRVEGAGGDGGVEAYWTKPNGKKTGYQAKYFLRSGDIDWGQIDKSVTQAIAIHPELECYVVALPCDLTDRTGKKQQGKTGWEHWDARVKKWQREAALVGITTITFQPWASSELTTLLTRKTSEGLLEYFFGDIQLSLDWFGSRIQEAVLALDERFHPEDHVDVRLEQLFSVISRTPQFRQELLSVLVKVKKSPILTKKLSDLTQNPKKETLDELQETYSSLLNIDNQIKRDPQHDWDIESWNALADKLKKNNNLLRQWYWEYERSLKQESSESYAVRKLIENSAELAEAINELLLLTSSRYIKAENQQVAFIRGNAGSGKSHLLAQCAQNAVAKNQPSILLLGQQFNDSDLWTQIAQRLGIQGRSAEQVLGALDASGKSVGVRALLLVDAVNEGAGSKYWRNHIASLIHRLKDFSHVCCIISCRSEYFDLAIPSNISDQYPTFEIRGFETLEEQQNAAKVYLDRRGIARPSTPWLSPEFINPLFLRSICISLERDKKSEFPPGLTGTKKILKYYLDSVGRYVTTKESSSVSLVPKLGRAVVDIAGKMLEAKADYLGLDSCRNVISSHFQNLQPQTESDWLSVFLNNGLLRKDPNPVAEDIFADENVVRFSFQRFQDFLMAEFSLQGVEKVDGLFDKSGLLDFCIENGRLAWEWRGLLDGLAIALPEKLSLELVDALPGGFEQWKNDWSIPNIFAESVKWRSLSAFSERTLDLLNEYQDELDALDLLLQVAVSTEHPWNAEFLHKNLVGCKLPDRDSWWTKWVNSQTDDSQSGVGVLIEWCRVGQVPHTNPENQFLAALTLCWLFTSSNRAIRDKSTKALTNILLARSDIFPKLLEQFKEVDDLYVLERLLAAAYGACCLDPVPTRLKIYSGIIFELIFKEGEPPFGILLRDYAFGVIELATYYSVLPDTVNFESCKPLYKSSKPDLSISDSTLDSIANKAGDNKILYSVAKHYMGDFARYEIEPRIRYFLNVSLKEKIPLSDKQRAQLFEDEVLGDDAQRLERYEILERITNPYWQAPSVWTAEDQKEVVKAYMHIFLQLLSDDEQERFHSDAAPYLFERKRTHEQEQRFDIPAIQRWIAKRAYDYGWTNELFPNDSSRSDSYSRDRPAVERIGKKYQWLALDELLSRLADNCWLKEDYGYELPRPYASPLDLGFERDIDPTIIEEKAVCLKASPTLNSWAFEPWINLDDVEEELLTDWPFEKDPAEQLKILPFRTAPHGEKWLVIYEHQSRTQKYKELLGERIGEHDSRIQEFRFLETVMVKASSLRKVAEYIEAKGLSGGVGLGVLNITDEAFLYEAPWRNTWRQKKWLSEGWNLPDEEQYAQMLAQYAWESHLDAALPDGYSAHLPLPWLTRELNLHVDSEQVRVWRDQNGETVFQEFKGEEGGMVCLIKQDKVNEILGECTFLTLLIAERNAWPGGSNGQAAWRRTEGVCWKDANGMNVRSWSQDQQNNF